jgi:hypothetical protein
MNKTYSPRRLKILFAVTLIISTLTACASSLDEDKGAALEKTISVQSTRIAHLSTEVAQHDQSNFLFIYPDAFGTGTDHLNPARGNDHTNAIYTQRSRDRIDFHANALFPQRSRVRINFHANALSLHRYRVPARYAHEYRRNRPRDRCHPGQRS